MAKDLIIGAASNYTWDHIKYWVNSIRRSGFEGDVAIVGTNISKDTIDRLTQEGVILSLYGTVDEHGNITSPKSGAPHVERFFYIWNFLETTTEEYGLVVTTDTRDVVFQTNPIKWLEDNLMMESMVAASEGMLYQDEPWNNRNLYEAFGPYFHQKLKDRLIYNVGTIGGGYHAVKGLLSLIFHLSVNRPIPIVDQAVYNFILHQHPFEVDTFFTKNENAWAIQLGTTLEAVQSGAGEIGTMKDKIEDYLKLYRDEQPIIEDGIVYNSKQEKFCIVHQWDRAPSVKQAIDKLYS